MIPSFRSIHDEFLHNRITIVRASQAPPVCTKLVSASPKAIDQLELGACTGCGSSRALKNALVAASYKWPFMPSALDIYAKVRILNGIPLTTDSGASVADVMTVLNTQGVCPEDSNIEWSWPFSASDDRWQQEPPPACEKDALKHLLVKSYRVNPDVLSIKTALLAGFPVVIGIAVYDSFESNTVAEDGIIPMPSDSENLLGGHFMRLDAYGMSQPGYVDGVNSWGQEWGDVWKGLPDKGRGRFHIPFDYLINSDLCTDLYALEVMT